MKRPNALSPSLMSPTKRRAELCRILALGVVRLQARNDGQHTDRIGELPLHNPAEQSSSADANHRREK